MSESREKADWFQRLPEHAKDEMRERWERSAIHNEDIAERRARTRRRYVVEAAVWFVIVFWMFHPWSWGDAALAAAAGSVVGLVAFFIRAGTFHYAPLGALGYLLFAIAYGYVSIFPFILCTVGSSALGVSHMLNRYDFVE
ncbi:MAG: hypothetical protein ACYTGN_00480 [Planctomycetota bacterium]